MANKLYSPHLPFVHFDEQWMHLYKAAGYSGEQSGVRSVQEQHLIDAMELAQEQHIPCEPSGIAGLALLLQMKPQVPTNAKILIVNTGKTKYPNSTSVETLLRHATTTTHR
jgi:threonine dehydratase